MVFGCAWKINFSENIFSWPCVLIDLNRKWFEVKIFTSNHLRTHTQRKREIALRSHHEPRAQSPSTSHPSTSSFFELNKIQLRLRLRIAPFDFAKEPRAQITPSTSPRSHPKIAPISLFPDLVPPSSIDTDLSLTLSSFFSQFDRIWWIFFGWVLFLYLSIEKWCYIFVWKLRKCEEQKENVFSILFSATQPNTRKYFSNHFLECNQTLENIFLSRK